MSFESEEVKKKHKRFLRNKWLKVHLITYVFINLILFVVNYTTNFDNMWFIYPLSGWGMLILIHTVAVVILNFLSNSKQASLAIHASITMITSSYLIWNDWWDNHRLNWILFAVVPLVLIWINHFILYQMMKKSDLSGKSRLDLLIQREYDKFRLEGRTISVPVTKKIVMNRLLLQNHIFIYAAVNLFLFLVNYFNNVDYWWFLWPTISWGMNILFHALIYVNIKKRSFGEKVTIKYFLVFPLTIAVYLIFIDVFSDNHFNWFWWPVGGIVIISLIVAKISSNQQIRKKASVKLIKKEKRQSSKLERRFCRNCGAPIKPNFQFCEVCGQRI
ncbi:2TM domain-containing protein [Candidatus Harpocratesius sp.]